MAVGLVNQPAKPTNVANVVDINDGVALAA
jgi:hypothetical protein